MTSPMLEFDIPLPNHHFDAKKIPSVTFQIKTAIEEDLVQYAERMVHVKVEPIDDGDLHVAVWFDQEGFQSMIEMLTQGHIQETELSL